MTVLGMTLGSVASAQQSQPSAAYLLSLLRDGYTMPRLEAMALEETLRSNPSDVASRAKLLGFYASQSIRTIERADLIEARRRHILWLIDNQPTSPLAAAPEAVIDARGHVFSDPKGYAEARRHWMALAESADPAPAIVRNAANFLQFNDHYLAEILLLRARERDPDDRAWAFDLGRLYALGILRVAGYTPTGAPAAIDFSDEAVSFARKARRVVDASPDPQLVGTAATILVQQGLLVRRARLDSFGQEMQRFAEKQLLRVQAWPMLARLYLLQRDEARLAADKRLLARKALDVLTRQLAGAHDDNERFRLLVLERIAVVAFQAGRLEDGTAYARDMLALAVARSAESQYAEAIHTANVVLGRIALQRGDLTLAKEHLKSAAASPGGGTLAINGPRMDLARDLLLAGERPTVVAYLDACRGFWAAGRDRKIIDEWLTVVRSGKMPRFEGYLDP